MSIEEILKDGKKSNICINHLDFAGCPCCKRFVALINKAIAKLEKPTGSVLDKLKKAKEEVFANVPSELVGLIIQPIEEAIADLQVKPTEFTKRFRGLIKLSEDHLSDNKIGRLQTNGREACDIIDRFAAKKKKDKFLACTCQACRWGYDICTDSQKVDLCENLGKAKLQIEDKDAENKAQAKRIEEMEKLIEEIEAVSCGEKQIESDGDYNDSDGMRWIYERIQALKEQ